MICSEGVEAEKLDMKHLTACAKRQVKHGWIQTPSSSIMLWSIRIS